MSARSPEGIAVSPGAVWVANAGGPSALTDRSRDESSRGDDPRGPKRACCAEHMSVIASPRAVWVALSHGKSIVRSRSGDEQRGRDRERSTYPPCGFLAADSDRRLVGWRCGADVVARSRLSHERSSRPSWPRWIRWASRSPSAPSGSPIAGTGNVDQIDPRTGRLVARLHVSRPRSSGSAPASARSGSTTTSAACFGSSRSADFIRHSGLSLDLSSPQGDPRSPGLLPVLRSSRVTPPERSKRRSHGSMIGTTIVELPRLPAPPERSQAARTATSDARRPPRPPELQSLSRIRPSFVSAGRPR